ncbi:xylan 1,4-beta-xylosidase [Segatella bryantii]|uniref:xylan 1,4-beta-xylosidase n=1 Tax=Segatella bryantii TaxID=77095 RepID=UPI00242DF577|nr:xylan 1,4-beta-xylosidase [Segatella bryantii]
MKLFTKYAVVAILTLPTTATYSLICAAEKSAQNTHTTSRTSDKTSTLLPYQNPNLSAYERAIDLCHRLTLEEKALLMQDESPAIPRLGIKKFFWWSEALHGAANMGNVTNFPEPIAMASSFNPTLLKSVFSAASDEMRAQYHHRMDNGGEDEKFHSLSVWTPNVNIFRDPRWGRGQETYGEDPYLTSVMGCAVVEGLQGPESSKYRKLWACAKHFAVHSGPESTRHTANLNNISPRDLYETYLPAFQSTVQDGHVREVMCAYQRLDDEPCCSNNRLLQQILREEWGFKYLVVSDCGAVSDIWQSHKTSSDAVHASRQATLAGTDVECGYGYTYAKIPEAVKRGLLTEEEIDKHVIRLLEGRFDLGEMDDSKLVEWSKIPYSIMSCKAHAQLALDMARQSIVLLQNKGNILPLQLKKNERIAVIGPNADNKPMMWGNYNGTPNHTVSILEGIRKQYKNVVYLPACDLTDKMVVKPLFNQCKVANKTGLKGTFWNNTKMSGKPVTTQYYNAPLAVTTAGMHNFAPGVKVEDFSAKYETTFTPQKSGEVVINVEGCGDFALYVNGKEMQKFHTWRTTPTRTPLQVKSGEQYLIEVRFTYVKTWGANLKINIGEEHPVDYAANIAQLKGIDKVIFVGGIAPSLEGEEMPVNIPGFKGGDRTDIEMPQVQRDFIKALAEAGKQIILVNCSGSAIALTPEAQRCQAIIQAWYPGQEGGTAVADILMGKVNPMGKLPVTFYKSTQQLPDFEDYSMKNRTYRYFEDALYPFGYGLSYTSFEIGTAKLQTLTNNSITLQIPVTNTGKREGTELVQVYLRRDDDVEGPSKTLRSFAHITLKAGETKKAILKLNRNQFECWDASTNTMRVIPGKYTIFYGNSSKKEDLKQIHYTLN